MIKNTKLQSIRSGLPWSFHKTSGQLMLVVKDNLGGINFTK